MDSSDDDKILPDLTPEKTKKVDKASTERHRKLQAGRDDHTDTDSDSDSDSDQSESEYVCDVCSKKFSGYIPFKQHEKSSKHLKALLKKKREKKLLDKITVAEKETDNDDELFLIKEPYAICKPCDKQFGTPESYHLHVVSKAHKQKVMQASILDQVKDNGEINVEKLKDFYKNKKTVDDDTEDLLEDGIAALKVKDDDDDDDDEGSEEFECKDCQKSFSGMIPYTQHILSKVHAKTVKRNKLLQKIAPKDIEYAAESNLRDLSTLVVEDDILLCQLCSAPFSGPESAMMHLKSRGHAKKLEKFIRKQERKQKATTTAIDKPKDNSPPDSDKSSSDFSDAEENFDNESGNKDSEQISSTSNKMTLSETAMPSLLKTGESASSSNKSESLINYEKYKKYKELINSVMQDDKDI